MQRYVGIGEVVISQDPGDLLVAPNLGSCLGITVYDPKRRIGGLIHCLLPLSKSDPVKSSERPCTYVDTGFVFLIDQILRAGGHKEDLVITVGGGGNINDEKNVFEIGKKNYTILKKILWKNNMLLKGEHVGDGYSRTVSLEVSSGRSSVKFQGETVVLWNGA